MNSHLYRAHLSLFATACADLDLTLPPPVFRTIQVLDKLAELERDPVGPVLDLTDEDLQERVYALALRRHEGANPISRGLTESTQIVTDQLLIEAREATLPHLDRLVEEVQPAFELAAAPLVRGAQEFGFTWQTTSDQVIDRADEEASAAWRAMKPAWQAVTPFTQFRQLMSKAFNVSPTVDEQDILTGKRVNHSICYAAGDNWGEDSSYYLTKQAGGGIDWFALAVGGLRLNTPTEVRTKWADRHHLPE